MLFRATSVLAATVALLGSSEARQWTLDKGYTSSSDVIAVPHFAGKPCSANGTCPWGPSCTICGNYCGPGWCGGQCVAEGPDCDFNVPPQEGSCTDGCCRFHDQCCGCNDSANSDGDCDISSCNKALADCLADCSWSSVVPGRKDCSGPDGYWGPKLIELIFILGEKDCCGSRCHSTNQFDLTLAEGDSEDLGLRQRQQQE